MGRFSASQERQILQDAIMAGTCMDQLPTSTRHKVMKRAEERGWVDQHFYTRTQMTILLRAGVDVFNELLELDHTTGRHELDLLTHRWATYLNVVKARIRTRSAAKNSKRQNGNSPGTGRRSKSLDSGVKP